MGKRKKPNNKGLSNGKEESTPRLIATQEYSGPIPPASEMAKYENAIPGSGDRILDMAQYALKIEGRDHRARNIAQIIDVVLGKLFIYFLVLVGAFLILKDKPIAGLVSLIPPVIAVVYRNTKSSNE